jgi:hypothetical protein
LSSYEQTPAGDVERSGPGDTIAGFLAAMSIAICLIGLAWHPLRLILPGIAIAMVSAGMAGPRTRRLAFAAAMIAAGCFFVGMLISVVATRPLW